MGDYLNRAPVALEDSVRSLPLVDAWKRGLALQQFFMCSMSLIMLMLQVPAVMPKGSCVIYLSSCLHGSGPNLTADRERIGLNVDYNLARIRTEENQYLSNPPSVT